MEKLIENVQQTPCRTLRTLLALLMLSLILSCSSKPDSPEQQVRHLLRGAEVAVKEKNLDAFRQLISHQYADTSGRDKRRVVGILRYHFLGNRSIHLFTRIKEIDFPQSGEAVVTLFVAMAGRPIVSQKDLLDLRADLHRFVISLVKESDGGWRAVRSEWRRARPMDFL
jgi:hypothetical protein